MTPESDADDRTGSLDAGPAVEVVRFGGGDRDTARAMFTMLSEVFETPGEPLGDADLDDLLARPAFWALGALVDGEVVGGLTAHVLPMTRSAGAELFVYDLAVRPEWQRQGVGAALMHSCRRAAEEAGIPVVFVAADDDDRHALEFYRAVGGAASPVTIFTFDA